MNITESNVQLILTIIWVRVREFCPPQAEKRVIRKIKSSGVIQKLYTLYRPLIKSANLIK